GRRLAPGSGGGERGGRRSGGGGSSPWDASSAFAGRNALAGRNATTREAGPPGGRRWSRGYDGGRRSASTDDDRRGGERGGAGFGARRREVDAVAAVDEADALGLSAQEAAAYAAANDSDAPESGALQELRGFNLTLAKEREFSASYDEPDAAHAYAVVVVHYHKTGYVLVRTLMKATIALEYEARNRTAKEIDAARNILGHEHDHFDNQTGAQIAFGQRGNWNSNYVPARRHNRVTDCPIAFEPVAGAIHLQEAPDFFCREEKLAPKMLGMPKAEGGRAKIVHFVRNPFDMVLSNYYYHAQKPSPEIWVHVDLPCQTKYPGGISLASKVLPALEGRTNITMRQLDDVASVCKSLWRTKGSLHNATFYEHLLELDRWDGLRLATAQMIVASSRANQNRAGGDVLRMANNVVKFENLRTSPSIPRGQRDRLRLLTVSMDDYIVSTKNATMEFLDFVLGRNDSAVSSRLRRKVAKRASKGREKTSHVTTGKHKSKDKLRRQLQDDPVFGPILSEVELLVDEAVKKSKLGIY
ncbi:hypothetical protein ACHAWF_007867, partial [Thalassiosira exigua]